MRIGLAFRVFWVALTDPVRAERLEQAVAALPAPDKPVAAAAPTPPSAPSPPGPGSPASPAASPAARPAAKPPARSDALTLLAALQREARLLDMIHEPLAQYSDAQIGAAARDVLRNCAGVIDRWFRLEPLLAQEEGSSIEVPAGYDPQRFRLVGQVAGEPPFRGQLVHRGWVASRCELPSWSGSAESVHVVAPVEVEVGARG
jgi:hypothetical protein